MNWLTNVVRPKIRSILKRETPENLWIKCPDSGQLVFYKDVEQNQFVIPGSNYHMRMTADARLKSVFDNQTWYDIALPAVTADPLKFRDERKYVDRIKDARAKTGMNEAVKVGFGKLEGMGVVVAVQDFDFMGGSLGMAAGEAIVRGMELAVEKKSPFIMFAASGGARMQEGILSLMQLPRTTVAVQMLREAKPALHRGADQSDDRRRHGVLRDARRRPDRRARRIDRVCRRPRHRADDPREIAGRIPARGISARPRHDRHGRASPRVARNSGAAVSPADEIAGARWRRGDAAAADACDGRTGARSRAAGVIATQCHFARREQ